MLALGSIHLSELGSVRSMMCTRFYGLRMFLILSRVLSGLMTVAILQDKARFKKKDPKCIKTCNTRNPPLRQELVSMRPKLFQVLQIMYRWRGQKHVPTRADVHVFRREQTLQRVCQLLRLWCIHLQGEHLRLWECKRGGRTCEDQRTTSHHKI